MNRTGYKQSLTYIAWGHVFIYFNVNIGTVNLLPSWIGLILILIGIEGVAMREPSARLLKPFAAFLFATELIKWILTIFDADFQWNWFHVFIRIIMVYLQFQLMTNLADIARKDGSVYEKRLRFLRDFQAIFVTGTTVIGLVQAEYGEILALLFAGCMIFIIGGIVITLFAYKMEDVFYIEIPNYVQNVLDRLNAAGYEAYIVGGCVRDSLLGKRPKDWDVCTSALPEDVLAVFKGEKTIPTGMQHGTVTVLSEGNPVEATTYRVDGEYKDGRHPEQVAFTRSLEEDLARRDFTINAMAYHPSRGVIDLYDGRKDLEAGVIRCVGESTMRFEEDALRMMRGLRFAAVLGFEIESETAAAMGECKTKLREISKERIQVELSKLLLGKWADQILTSYIEIVETAVPGIQLPQRDLNVLPQQLVVRLAEVFPIDTRTCLRDLKWDNETIKTAGILADLRKEPISTNPLEMNHFLRKYGADISKLHYERAGELTALEELLKQNPCYRLSDLALDGGDLIAEGIEQGPHVGRILNWLLDEVIEQRLPNQKEILLEKAKEKLGYE